MEKHYICLGGCNGVSPVPGVCQASDCVNHNHELVKCECTDGLHNNFKQKINTENQNIKKMSLLTAIAPLLLMLFTTLIFAFLLYPSFFAEHKNEIENGYPMLSFGLFGISFIVLAPFSLIVGIIGFRTGSKYRRLFGGTDGYGIMLMVISLAYIFLNYRLVIFVGEFLYPYLQLNCPNC